MNWPEHIKNSPVAAINQHLLKPDKKKSKYGNKGVEFDGKKFDSKRECARYIHLRVLLKQGLISDLRLQVPYELNEGGTHSLKYLADFVYKDETGKEVVNDSKGCRTAVYKKKKRLMKQIYNIEILET